MKQMKNASLLVRPGGHGDYIGEVSSFKPANNKFPALSLIEDFLT
jgi:hypothetical protein